METLFNDVGGDDFGVVSRVAVAVGTVEAAVDVLGIEFVVNIFRQIREVLVFLEEDLAFQGQGQFLDARDGDNFGIFQGQT